MQNCGFISGVSIGVNIISLKSYTFTFMNRKSLAAGADLDTPRKYCNKRSCPLQGST